MKGLAHIGIYASDPKKCADFYVEHLGFHHYAQEKLKDFSIFFVENSGCIIEFLEKKECRTDGVIDHIALEVQGIEILVGELKEKGIIQEDVEIGKIDNFFANGVKNIFFYGPAGERVELFDYTGRKE